MTYAEQARRTLSALGRTPGWHRLVSRRAECDEETLGAVLEAAAEFAETELAPLDAQGDRTGARLVEGRVLMPAGFPKAYRALAEHGWLGVDISESAGGQGLPLAVQAACAPLFDRACLPLMMAAISTRAAAHLLLDVADTEISAEWVPNLLSGTWAATICISEPDAGSDLARIRTRAEHRDGQWHISGQKIWISFGDHDMSERIGHCVLARTDDRPGTRGLGLFLVPDSGEGCPNGVTVDRIEEKMGLHASPTCALRFEDARGILLGEEGRGLPQLFVMIRLMRLATGCQGLGIASVAADIAERYADDRRQGGASDSPPVPSSTHADVRRQIQEIRADTEILRAAVLELAVSMDLASTEDDSEQERFIGWMLPLIKTFGAETGFCAANAAIQVLGGAGYTREWPLERHLRDARVLSIYEGTTGMQALDFLTRRLWRDEGAGLTAFLTRARSEAATYARQYPGAVEAVQCVLDDFERLSGRMAAMRQNEEAGLWRADAYMRAGWDAVSAWLALRAGEFEAIGRLAVRHAFHVARCA